MLTHPHARPARICDDADLNDRFCYWQGASGRTYIHSVYPAKACPPLPGAIYIAVRRDAAGNRHAVGAGHFDDFHPYSNGPEGRPAPDELHVHMLARNSAEATRILGDLQAALFSTAHGGHRDNALPAHAAHAVQPGLHEPIADLFSHDQPHIAERGRQSMSASVA